MFRTNRLFAFVAIVALAASVGACSGTNPNGPDPTPLPGGGNNPPANRPSSVALKAAIPEAPATVKVATIDPRTQEVGGGAMTVMVKWSVSDEKIAEARTKNLDIVIKSCLWTVTPAGTPMEVFGGCAGKGVPLEAVTGEAELVLRVWENTPSIKQTNAIVTTIELRGKNGEILSDGVFANDRSDRTYNWDFTK